MPQETIDLNELGRRISSGESIESVMEKHSWMDFEGVIAGIFSENGFHVVKNFRFKTSRRYEVDLICSRSGRALVVDCKRWGAGRYKSSGLRRSVSDQKERVGELSRLLDSDSAARKKAEVSEGADIQPLVVTLMEESIAESEGCFIVPAWKLNQFLLEM